MIDDFDCGTGDQDDCEHTMAMGDAKAEVDRLNREIVARRAELRAMVDRGDHPLFRREVADAISSLYASVDRVQAWMEANDY